MHQTTLCQPSSCSGISLHSGREVSMEFKPAEPNTGIVFCVHTPNGLEKLSVTPTAVSTTELATTISNGKVSVSTIEHVLATFNALQIDNVEIHVEGNEVPILDGSARLIVEAIHKSGIKALDCPRRVARITKEFSFVNGMKSIIARPYDGFRIDYTIRFPHPLIGEQRFVMEVTPENYLAKIADARTFGFFKEVEYLHAKGLAMGGSLDNVVVLDDNGVMNKEGLRYPDEFVRHKILDFIGDMAMFGKPLLGNFTVECSGHAHNNAFLRALELEASALTFITL